MLAFADDIRRAGGGTLDFVGLGPRTTPSRIAARGRGFKLRAYQPARKSGRPVLLIVAAPIKRAYVWDLLPAVSVVARCLRRGLAVYLLEWTPPGAREDAFGLAEYADSLILAGLDTVSAETGRKSVALAAHSLGGTLAALFAGLHPERVQALVLVDAPLAFGAQGGPFARSMALMPSARVVRQTFGSPVPGVFLNLVSVAAVPSVFVGQHWDDLAASLSDPLRSAIHARVMRWSLDEFPLPGRLFEDMVELLYRRDQFRQGTLRVGGSNVRPESLRAPTLAVINRHGGVVPPDSVLAALAPLPAHRKRVLQYEAEPGPVIQHLGPLVGPNAHKRLWPEILDWVCKMQSRPRAEPSSAVS